MAALKIVVSFIIFMRRECSADAYNVRRTAADFRICEILQHAYAPRIQKHSGTR